MKIKSIKIQGLHKVESATYELGNTTYFVGKNGAGKSTVLQGIQLVILGYLPGHGKTNAEIMKHCSGNILNVEAILEDDSNEVKITRTWMKSGNSVKANVSVDPCTIDIPFLVQDVELPIYNFGEFRGMTANKLKEWFINYLPQSETSIPWEEVLRDSLKDRPAILDEEFLESMLATIEDVDGEGVDKVKKVNEILKSHQQFAKTQIARLQGTMDSLIYYDNLEPTFDITSAKNRIQELRELLKNVASYKAQQQALGSLLESIKQLEESLVYPDMDSHPEYKRLLELNKEQSDKIAELSNIGTKLSENKNEIKMARVRLSVASSDICPYTQTRCDKIADMIESTKAGIADLDKQMTEVDEEIKKTTKQIQEMQLRLSNSSNQLHEISRKYEMLASLKSRVPSQTVELRTSRSEEDIQNEINVLEEKLVQAQANLKFEELNKTVMSDKLKLENQLEVLKIWINLTGANGLQSSLMDGPFVSLSSDMNRYLSIMFGEETRCNFNLEEKANSFSFGMMRGSKYLEFDLLSSGEQCLFTFALMMCLLDRSSSSIRLILADDILDHLDSENAGRLFNYLASSQCNIQFVLAGVQPCNIADLCYRIGE